MPKTIVITGASSGFGASSARHLADAGHTVYAGIRGTTGKNTHAVADATSYATEHHVELRPIEMDVSDQGSVDAAIMTILAEAGGIDVVVHNAGHMVLGPAEAFTLHNGHEPLCQRRARPGRRRRPGLRGPAARPHEAGRREARRASPSRR
jgi:NAD(P)-dependent dehydrogenase (short-subunit alcohol dehydrogenase family)